MPCGYTPFMQQEMTTLTNQGIDIRDRLRIAADRWKLTPESKFRRYFHETLGHMKSKQANKKIDQLWDEFYFHHADLDHLEDSVNEVLEIYRLTGEISSNKAKIITLQQLW